MRIENTQYYKNKQFRLVCLKLRREIGKSLGIYKILDWLNKKLNKKPNN